MDKRIIVLATTLIVMFPFCFSFAENKMSLRESFINSGNTETVIAVDDYYTHVFPKTTGIFNSGGIIQKEFTKELISLCSTRWEIKDVDPITSNEVWVPYDGKSDLYYRSTIDKATQREQITMGARCAGKFEIVKTWGAWESIRSVRYFTPLNFIVRHEDPQPFLYKSTKVPAIEDVTMLPDGEIKSLKKAERGFFSKLFDTDKQDSIDIFMYMNSLCRKVNGKVRLVANQDRLIEVDPFNGYKHIFAGGYKNTGAEKIWYFACEGHQQFVVREDESIIYTNKRQPISSYKAIFAANRGLEGVNYIKKAIDIQTPAVVGLAISEEDFAIEVAKKEKNQFKMSGAHEYIGTFNGKDSEKCALVTVRKIMAADSKIPRVDTFQYKICNGSVAKAPETGFQRLPQGIDVFIQKLAKVAQETGNAEGQYQGHDVKANALRDKDKCAVEIKVLKDMNLLSTLTVDGCK